MLNMSSGTNGDSTPGHLALVPPIRARELSSFRNGGDPVPYVERVVSFFDDQGPEVCDPSSAADKRTKTPGQFRGKLNA